MGFLRFYFFGISLHFIVNKFLIFTYILSNALAASPLSRCLLKNNANSIYTSIPENLTQGSLVTNIPFLDEKITENGVNLELLRGSEFVILDAQAKKLLLRKAIDRDTGTNKFEAIVHCSSAGTNGSLIADVNITTFVFISDVNDNSPKFPHPEFFIKLPEELPVGTLVPLDFKAVDNDQNGPNSFVHYKIVNIKPRETTHKFESAFVMENLLTIPESHTPQLVIGDRIDFESIQSFDLDIVAEDSGRPPLSSKAKIYVQILDVDDLNPQFDFELYTAHISTNQLLQILPKPIFAKDADSLNQPVEYSLSGNNSHKFAIDKHTAEIRFICCIDDLPKADVILIVHAHQIGRLERKSQTVLVVRRNETIFESTKFEPYSSYFVQIPSNYPTGKPLLELQSVVSSVSKIVDSNETNQDNIPFTFDNTVLALLVSGSPLKSEYNLNLIGQKDEMDVFINVRVQVQESRGARPEFDRDEYLFEFDPANGEIVGQINAKTYLVACEDKESIDQGCSLFYSLLNDNGDFLLDTYDGTLSIKDMLKLKTEFPIELVAMVEDVEGQRNFVRILINCVYSMKRKISLSAALGVLCFLSFVGNAVLITALFGRRKTSNNYVTMGTRRQHTASHFWTGNACFEAGDVTITNNALAPVMDTDSFSTLSLSKHSNLTAKF